MILEKVAQILYDRDIIQIRKGEVQVDFQQSYAWPQAIDKLSGFAAEVLDDYAIDSICTLDEALPFGVNTAKYLDLPLQWFDGEKLYGFGRPGEEIKRTMFISLLSPPPDGRKALVEFYKSQGIELVGVFSLLAMGGYEEDITRDLFLINFAQLIELYHQMYLITPDEYEKIKALYEGNSAAEA